MQFVLRSQRLLSFSSLLPAVRHNSSAGIDFHLVNGSS